MTDTNLIEIFCIFDDFCKYFTPELKKHTLQIPGKRHRNRASRMSDSEIMTILVLFHTHRFRDLKSFYLAISASICVVISPHRAFRTTASLSIRTGCATPAAVDGLEGFVHTRGYINQNLFKMLFVDNIHLVTKIKKNMKNSLMSLYDKLLLRKSFCDRDGER